MNEVVDRPAGSHATSTGIAQSHAGLPPETPPGVRLGRVPVARAAHERLHPLTNFSDLGLDAPILRALADEGYAQPTPIQAQAIPPVLAGRDLLGIAQTGTGKTAAFALPILQRLARTRRAPQRRACRALVLAPTRELASQIGESFRAYGRHLGLSTAIVFGGVPFGAQARMLGSGVDVVVATPGRLLDHLGQGTVRLDAVETLVLDEADHMLDLGFIVAIRKLVRALPRERQNLFFSATMPREIDRLAAEILREPARVAVTPAATPVERVDQRVIHVGSGAKNAVLASLLAAEPRALTLVFTRTKRGADKVVRHLEGAGIDAAAIHGNKSQSQRERALAGFKAGRTRTLVATDIAARGIDVDGVTHVVNYDLPHVPESYVHRIGRTARAGAAGIAIAFCGPEERLLLRDIEKLLGRAVPSASHPQANAAAATLPSSVPHAASRSHGPRSAAAPREFRGRPFRGGRSYGPRRPQHPGRAAAG